jgi:hypothetical protein
LKGWGPGVTLFLAQRVPPPLILTYDPLCSLSEKRIKKRDKKTPP